MRRVLTSVLAVLLLVVPAAAVHAHGGKAEEALIQADTSYPFGVDAQLRDALDGQVAAARKAGYAVKVALVNDIGDLGTDPQWLTDPQAYADHLSTTLSFGGRERVLTVHHTGFGGNDLGERAGPALRGLAVEGQTEPDTLARAAMKALDRLTAAEGRRIPAPAIAASSGDDGGTSPLIIVGGIVLLVVFALVLTTVLSRGQDEEADDDGDGAPGEGEPAPA